MTKSGAGWSSLGSSDVVQPEDETEASIGTPERDRYEIQDRLGQGGMGTVFVALDRRLGREVALKHVSLVASSPAAQARLAREAEITAWLEHPNIVPVYDAGVEDEGVHFYTMRLVRGRSLGEAIEDAREAEDERTLRALLRHYLAACQAVAFAHSRGVVHRDLTPANIMVGAFGETQVVDWGLAARLGDDALPVVGTPGYMSPDAAATTQGDVWSLGAILKDILAPRGTSLLDVGEDAPGELFAVLRGCLSDDPAERFADASVLANEIEHYLDGRRIASHEYSVAELLGRAWRAWRPQILAAGMAVLVVIVVSVVAWLRLSAERDRATAAEQETQVALRARSKALRESLQQQALALLSEGNTRASEAVTLQAMELGETPRLRGALLNLHARPRPVLRSRRELPDCEKIAPIAEDVAVCWGGAAVMAYDLARDEALWSIDVVATQVRGLPGAVAILDAEGVVSVHALDTGEVRTRRGRQSRFAGLHRDHDGTWIATSGGRFVDFVAVESPGEHARVDACGEELVAAIGLGRTQAVVACRSGRLMSATIGEWSFESAGAVPIHDASVPLVALAVSADDRLLAVSNSNGESVLMGIDGETLSPRTKVAPGMTELQFVDDHVLVNPANGRPSLWNLAGRTTLLELPGASATYRRLVNTLVTVDANVVREWSVPRPLVAHAFRADAGVAAASEAGDRVAGASADGAVTVWNRGGTRRRTLAIGPGVVKRAVFSPDESLLAVADGSDGGLLLFDARTWARLPSPRFAGGVRTLEWSGEQLVVAPYRERVQVIGGKQAPTGPAEAIDVSVGSDGEIAALAKDGTVWWWDATGDAFRPVNTRPGATSLHILPGGPRVATSVGVHVEVRRADTEESVGFRVSSASVTDIASTEDGRVLLVATVDGDIEAWTTESPMLLAKWSAHRGRVSHLRVRDGVLLSAGWDGWVKRWPLDPLAFELSQFERASLAAWGS